MAISASQITAAETVMRKYLPDMSLSAAAVFLEAYNAFMDAAPGRMERAGKDEPEGFDKFYAAYPRRQARRDAANAYRAALLRAPSNIILDATVRYAGLMAGDEPKYIKLPATWLRADCWKDEQPTLSLAAAAFEETTEDGWVKRLEMWMGQDGHTKGTWRKAWGPKPKEEGCRIPESAKTAYLKLYPPKSQNQA